MGLASGVVWIAAKIAGSPLAKTAEIGVLCAEFDGPQIAQADQLRSIGLDHKLPEVLDRLQVGAGHSRQHVIDALHRAAGGLEMVGAQGGDDVACRERVLAELNGIQPDTHGEDPPAIDVDRGYSVHDGKLGRDDARDIVRDLLRVHAL